MLWEDKMKVSERATQQAAARFGIDASALSYLGGEDGDVYEFERAGRAYIFKLVPTPEPKLEAVREKIAFAHYLGENGVRVSRPLASPSGKLAEIVREGDEVVVASLYEKAIGQHPDAGDPSRWNADVFRRWGRVMGRMHALTRRYEGGAHIIHWDEETAFMRGWCRDEGVRARWDEMMATLEGLPRPADAYGLIHNDLHPWNFVLDRGEPVVFDFDVCAHHWFATDLGIALFHAHMAGPADKTQSRAAFGRFFLDRFMEGYSEENLLAEEWLRRLPLFCGYRRLLLFTVFYDGWSRPDARPWQRRQIEAWHRSIIDGVPVIDLSR
jgi:Ser/Thr protein kinase RdoA (MazF antagonist)